MSTANDNNRSTTASGDDVVAQPILLGNATLNSGGGIVTPAMVYDPDLPLVDDSEPDPCDPPPNSGDPARPIGDPDTPNGDPDTSIGDPDALVFSDNFNAVPSVDLLFNAAGELIDPVDAAFDALISAPVSEIGNRIDVMMHFDADDFII